MVFLEPPPESLEHWQQLERALELLERQDRHSSSTASPPSRSDPQPGPQTQDHHCHQGSSSAARSGEQAGQPARQVADCGSIRGVQQRSGNSQRSRQAHMVSLQAEGVLSHGDEEGQRMLSAVWMFSVDLSSYPSPLQCSYDFRLRCSTSAGPCWPGGLGCSSLPSAAMSPWTC